MKKLKMHSPDLTQDNIAKIRELFPNCVTEAHDVRGGGGVRLVVDFDMLRQELSDHVVEGHQERYHLNWPGKKQALLLSNSLIAKCLRPIQNESSSFNETRNLVIEGDNLDAMKQIQYSYLDKIKLIYIDPPYNTGSDLIYPDSFVEETKDYLVKSKQVDDEDRPLISNQQSNGRFHSDWLTMMYSRLRIAKKMLRQDGAIFVSIDFNELANLKLLMDEIFGSENFQRQIVWRIGWLSGFKTTTQNFIRNHDVILFYSKDSTQFKFNKKYIENKDFKPLVKNGATVTDWLSKIGLDKKTQRELLNFINHENRPERYPIEDTWNCNEYDDLNSISIVSFSSEKISKILNIEQEFKGQKSIQLLKRILVSITSDDDLILDFFAGTASMAHATLQLNSEDGGNRRFVMIQIPESLPEDSNAYSSGYRSIVDIAKERIRRSGKKILEGKCHPDWNKDVGFRVLKIDSSNMKDVFYQPDKLTQKDLLESVDYIKEDRNAEDLLFQVLLDWGVDLTLPIQQEKLHGKTVFFVDENALVACFDKEIDEDLVKELAQREPAPLRVVFRDNGFISDAVKINVEQIFKQLSPTTEVRAI
ncbi:MAG: site-specific DNA-methyltransferase [Gammaproteobacteria bacterium]|nr:site-specific DNA-methyltransferase [Gammaproteobacteria bacterium]